MFQVFLMYALFGSIFSVGKIALEASEPFFLTAIRMLIAGGCLIGYLYFTRPSALYLPKKLWPVMGAVAVFNVFITNAFEFWGLQYMHSGKTSLIYSLSPFFAALLAYTLGTEQMTRKKWMGLAVAMVAFGPLMLQPWFEESQTPVHSLEMLAEAALLTSATCCVIGWYFVKKLAVVHEISGVAINGYSFVIAGVLCLIPSFFFEEWQPVPVTKWTDFLWTLCYIIIIHNLICYSIYAHSLKRFSVTFMSFAGLSSPLFAGLFGWFFLKEEISSAFFIALVGITIGLLLFSFEEKKKIEIEQSTTMSIS